jgi:hypothetical protein
MGSVDLTLVIDAADGQLIAAFTPTKSRWIAPIGRTANPEQVAKDDGWTVSSIAKGVAIQSTVVEVLEVVWRDDDIDPRGAGQIIVRPRTVATALPAVEVGGKLVPVRKPRTAWVIHVLGTVTIRPGLRGQNRPPYMSGLIQLIEDQTKEASRGVYLP